jgi:hypothetical protein
LAAIVIHLLVAGHAVGQARMAERNELPILADVAVGARAGIVVGWQHVRVTIQTLIQSRVTELDIVPIVRTMAVGT